MWVIIAAVVVAAIVAAALAMQSGKPSPPTAPMQTVTQTVTHTTAQTVTQTVTATQTVTQTTVQTVTQTVTATQPQSGPSLQDLIKAAPGGTIYGAGATFPLPQLQAWADAFNKYSGGKLNVDYQGVGSGAGQTNFLDKKVDFAGSDIPMTDANFQKVKGRFYQFPELAGSIVIAYNVPEIAYQKTGKYLYLTAEVIALIYMGNITQWCDPRIKALNPALANELPCKNIVAVHRSDGSGTTAYFTLWLSKAYKPWSQTVGWGLSVEWPVDKLGTGRGGKGNPGVAQLVEQTPYSIGYIEYAYYALNKRKYDGFGGAALVRNDNDGKFYSADPQYVQMGLAAGLDRYKAKYGAYPAPDADWNAVIQELSNPPTGYPLSALTFIMVYKDYAAEGYADAAARTARLRAWLTWILTEGQKQVIEGYVPLPPELAEIGLKAVQSIKP
jgi:phosphate transport system substrate-binding protein